MYGYIKLYGDVSGYIRIDICTYMDVRGLKEGKRHWDNWVRGSGLLQWLRKCTLIPNE